MQLFEVRDAHVGTSVAIPARRSDPALHHRLPHPCGEDVERVREPPDGIRGGERRAVGVHSGARVVPRNGVRQATSGARVAE